MSYVFEVDGKTLWSPALRVGQVYVAAMQGMAERLGVPGWMTPIASDFARLDRQEFVRLVQQILTEYIGTDHPVLRVQLRAPLLISLIILERMGEDLGHSVDSDLATEAAALARHMPA